MGVQGTALAAAERGPGAEQRWADIMGAAHPPTIPELATESSCDKARGGRPVRAVGAKPPNEKEIDPAEIRTRDLLFRVIPVPAQRAAGRVAACVP